MTVLWCQGMRDACSMLPKDNRLCLSADAVLKRQNDITPYPLRRLQVCYMLAMQNTLFGVWSERFPTAERQNCRRRTRGETAERATFNVQISVVPLRPRTGRTERRRDSIMWALNPAPRTPPPSPSDEIRYFSDCPVKHKKGGLYWFPRLCAECVGFEDILELVFWDSETCFSVCH